jgi:hypothetical protein
LRLNLSLSLSLSLSLALRAAPVARLAPCAVRLASHLEVLTRSLVELREVEAVQVEHGEDLHAQERAEQRGIG